MQNLSVDTPHAEPVAPGAPFPAVPLTAITAIPRLAAQSGALPANPELTIAESMVLHCAREWRQAETDPVLYAELNAWDAMRLYANDYRDGRFSHTEAQEIMGYHDEAVSMAFYNAVVTIAGLVHLFNDDYNPAAVPAEGSERQ